MRRANDAIMNDMNVSHRRGANAVRKPIKGEDNAYVAHIKAKKYPILL